MWSRNNKLSEEPKWISFLSRLNREIGRPEAIFSAFFIWGVVIQFGVNSNEFNGLLLFWVVFMILNLPSLAKTFNHLFSRKKKFSDDLSVGKIFKVEAKSVFWVKLFPDKNQNIATLDFVEFNYSVNGLSVSHGVVLESYFLNEEKWLKVLASHELQEEIHKPKTLAHHSKDIIYKVDFEEEPEFMDRFVGLVEEGSNISRLRFMYYGNNPVEEGQLLQVKKNESEDLVYYQIVEGITKFEHLEGRNEDGYTVGEAVQLGTWDSDNMRFDKYGWVPNINTLVSIAQDLEVTEIEEGFLQIGSIPGTNFPVVLNKELALTHHTAVLGVTGTGKSVFSRNLIREYLEEDDIKVICVDFTGEYRNKFQDLQPVQIISDENNEKLYKIFEWVSNELEKFGNQQDKKKLKEADERIATILNEGLTSFLESEDSRITIFELPDVVNTSGVLEYTRQMFKALFNIAKANRCFGNKVCIVLEEAHTVIPEWNFVGISDKSSQSLLNSISQIALQGRKYDVGLLVIAQRTANVSKTVLTQCNTIISFQEFDKTSSDFLANYFGQGIADSLPNLKFRQAIAAGKAMKSNVPMIFEVPEITENDGIDAAAVVL
ncbi:MAG: ATP-binding protein [Fluviicola sp.]